MRTVKNVWYLLPYMILAYLLVVLTACGHDAVMMPTVTACTRVFPVCGGSVTGFCLQAGPSQTVTYRFIGETPTSAPDCQVSAVSSVTCNALSPLIAVLVDSGSNVNILGFQSGDCRIE